MLVGRVNGMVMSRVVGNGQRAMDEVGGVMDVMDGLVTKPSRNTSHENSIYLLLM